MPLWYQYLRSPILILQSMLFATAFGYAFRRRKKFVLSLGLSTVAALVLSCILQHQIYIPGESVKALISHAVVSLINFLLLMGIIAASLDESKWTILFLTSMSSIGSSMAGCVKTIFRILPLFNSLAMDSHGIIAADAICYGGLAFTIYRLFFFYTSSRVDTVKYKSKILFSTAAVLVYLAMSWLIMDFSQSRRILLITNFFAVIVLAMVYMIQFGVMEREQLTEAVENMRELMHQQKSQYETSRESVQLINEKYHDLKGIIASIQPILPEEEVRRLSQSIKRYDARVQTGTEVLDTVLTEKMDICLQRGISLTCSTGGVDFSFMDELDIYSLFNNALTNAINAVSDLPRNEARFIMLLVSQDGNMVSIHIENPCPEEVVFLDGLPQTKSDPNWHGFGMKSMERTAQKYGGAISANWKNRRFQLDVLLLILNKSR